MNVEIRRQNCFVLFFAEELYFAELLFAHLSRIKFELDQSMGQRIDSFNVKYICHCLESKLIQQDNIFG